MVSPVISWPSSPRKECSSLAERCSDIARDLDEPMAATASVVRRWLLVEHDGSWPHRDWDQCVPHDVRLAVSTYAKAHGARAVLVRVPSDRAVQGDVTGRLLFASCGPDSRWLREIAAEPRAMREALDPARDFGEGASERPGPMYLVCTHSTHDVCCGIRGRSLARAGVDLGLDVWECSHIGGDRFAANVVVLPHGLYYGQVEVADLVELAAATEDGRIVTERYRGRSFLRRVAQGAEHFVRADADDWRIDAVEHTTSVRTGDARWRVEVQHETRTVVVEVREEHGPERTLTCKGQPARPTALSVEPAEA
jgi:hypothetical protein